MQRYAYVVERKARMAVVDGQVRRTPEQIVWPEEGVLYYDAESRKTDIALLVPLLKDLADKGIGTENIDEAAISYPFAQS